MRVALRTLAIGILGLLVNVPEAGARPMHKQALADYFGPLLARRLNDCRTCHLPEQPGSSAETEKPHNAFGRRLKEVRKELQKAGKRNKLVDALEAIAFEDSDGDGVPNILELLSGHYPGESEDRPTASEAGRARERLTAFREMKRGYQWKPFDPVARPSVPSAPNSDWDRNPVDAFIAAEHRAQGLKPRSQAAPDTLLRRVYLDLIGLPPTPEERRSFLADPSPAAYARVVDRLLNSPQYGERWGRHWMDVWRYSDWAGWGQQVRDSQPHIWHWRDWIVESLNQDKGYDRMILEMLAADELAPQDTDALRGTGFLVRNYKLLSRETWMQEAVEHTAQAFLGITLGCARCHDHMFDPFLQKEYYQVRAVFEPHQVRIDRLSHEPDTSKDGLPRVYDGNPDAKTYLFVRGDERTHDDKVLEPGVPDALGARLGNVHPVTLPLEAFKPGLAEAAVRTQVEKSRAAITNAMADQRRAVARTLGTLTATATSSRVATAAALEQARHGLRCAELALELARNDDRALVAALTAERMEAEGRKGTTLWQAQARLAVEHQRRCKLLTSELRLAEIRAGVQVRQTAKKPAPNRAELVEKQLALLRLQGSPIDTNYASMSGPSYPATSTGRRLAFARWLAAPSNPLTARVAMNHMWVRHFGQGLVPSVADFGRNGRPPSHPALLDWLADEFTRRDWSMKAMHRLLVTSNTYKQASTPDADCLARDPDNRFLWRMTPRRLEAEAVRDGILYVGGGLDTRFRGADIDQTKGLLVPRRTIYFRTAAEKQMEFVQIFDGPSVNECYERRASVMPQQALALSNSDLAIRLSRELAGRLDREAADDDAQYVRLIYERVLSRLPNPPEIADCIQFLHAPPVSGVASAAGSRSLRRREMLVHVILNHHEFVTLR